MNKNLTVLPIKHTIVKLWNLKREKSQANMKTLGIWQEARKRVQFKNWTKILRGNSRNPLTLRPEGVTLPVEETTKLNWRFLYQN